MPADTPKGKIITWTSLGLFFGVFSFEAIGAVCTAVLPDEYVISALALTGDGIFAGLGTIMLIIGGAGLLGLMAMCVYGGSLTIITAMDSLRKVIPTRQVRIWTILLVGLTSTYAGAYMPADFLNTSFWTILVVLSYLMAPWTAINLTDFFLVRRGHYSIREMFSRAGIYGKWNMRGIVAYLVTFAIMIPFMILPFYTGSVATALGGVDIAFFVGIPVGGILYWVLCLSMDMKAERAIVDKADANLDRDAAPIS
jgi:purine-cytosine permease-like protein